MCAENEYARLVTKMASGLPTVPVSASHNNGDWLDTDIYEGELYIDSDTGKIYTRTASGIIDIGAVVSVNIYNTDDVFTGNREADLDGNTLFLKNGPVTAGNDIALTQASFNSSMSGGGNGFFHGSDGDGIAFMTFMTQAGATFGFYLQANHNTIFDSDVSPQPTNETSSIHSVYSTRKGVLSTPRMTETERDAIVSPADYLEIVNTTRERKEIYRPFWGWHPVGAITPDWGYEIFDENTAANTWFVYGVTSTGVASPLVNASLSPTVLFGMGTGANASGEYRHLTGKYFVGSTGKKYYKNLVSFDTLSTVTDRYVALAGYLPSATGLSFLDGMYFLYDEGGVFGTATASNNWLCVVRNGGVFSVTDSGVAVTDVSSGALQKIEILDDGTGTSCVFKINGIVVHTAITGIPDNTKSMYIGERMIKSGGTTPRVFYIDYSYAKEKFNTPR